MQTLRIATVKFGTGATPPVAFPSGATTARTSQGVRGEYSTISPWWEAVRPCTGSKT
jgi:hypothetical protein